jgi:hypothetical protein
MTRTAKVRQSLHTLADRLEVVLTQARIVRSLHQALATSCRGRRWPNLVPGAIGFEVQPMTITLKEGRAAESLPGPRRVEGLSHQVEAAWHGLGDALKAADGLTREEEGLARAVDLVPIQAALNGLREHYSPHSFGYRLSLPQRGEPSLVFAGIVAEEPPDGFLEAMRAIGTHIGALRIIAPAAETVDTKARRLLSAPLVWRVWSAIPGKDGPRATYGSIADQIGSTPEAVRKAFGIIRRTLGPGAIRSTRGSKATHYRPDRNPE